MKAKQMSEIPSEFKYVNDLVDDAAWLILTELQRRETTENPVLLPREVTLKISLMKSPKRLPVEVATMIRLGTPYDKQILESYSSRGDMGLPSWYFPNPLEYWEKEAVVDYLQVKPELI